MRNTSSLWRWRDTCGRKRASMGLCGEAAGPARKGSWWNSWFDECGMRGLARAMCRPRCHVYFAWIRGGSYPAVAQFEHDARLAGLTEKLPEPDVFVRTSRGDPYPLVCLERLPRWRTPSFASPASKGCESLSKGMDRPPYSTLWQRLTA